MRPFKTAPTLTLSCYSYALTILSMFLWFTPTVLTAHCLTCHDFTALDNGYKSSVSSCDVPENCFVVLANPKDFLTELHPGFTTTQSNGFLAVSTVVHGSPADQAGILMNDVILQVNGRPVGISSCEPRDWESKPGSRVSRLVVRRNGQEHQLTVRLLPIRALLSAQWITSSPHSGLVSARFNLGEQTGSLVGTYMFGVQLIRKGDASIVSAVLRASPAEKAGLRPGDKILSLEGNSLELIGMQTLSDVVPTNRSYTTKIQVQRGTRLSDITLTSVGVSEILRGLGATRPLSVGTPAVMGD